MTDLFKNQADEARPVECLGKTFANDKERREHFLRLLSEKLKDPSFRKLDGFPIGSDEDILALSDPPYYTACPNPFVVDFFEHYGTPYDSSVSYRRGLFAADVSEGKNDPIYNAHSYHTKVPPRAIVRYILNYTEPGDLVFDGFCGTGMTAVAAQLCGDRKVIEDLGYRVESDGTILAQEKDGNKTEWREFSKLGARRAVVNDLSPAATFIAYNYNRLGSPSSFDEMTRPILSAVERKFSWMYQTLHQPTQEALQSGKRLVESEPEPDLSKVGSTGKVNYVVWSDVFTCPDCAGDIVFWDVAVDREEGKVRDVFPCPHCDASLGKRNLEAKNIYVRDEKSGVAVSQRLQVPAYINYSMGKKRFEKNADAVDKALADKISTLSPQEWFPSYELKSGDKTGEPIRLGITHTHHFYTPRILQILAQYRSYGLDSWAPFSALTPRATRMHRIAASRLGGKKKGEGGATVGVINGTLYVPSLSVEMNVLDQASDRVKAYAKAWFKKDASIISTQSSTALDAIPSDSLDYVFIDPPFGANLMYSELNSLWEGWLRVFTNEKQEAVENKTQGKHLDDYRNLMTESFREIFRILKPGRWVTIEFSNTQASVWNSIQTALQESGLVVANVSALDKKQGSFNAVTNPTSVKQDLVISAYKPNGGLEARFLENGGAEESVWDFVRSHLKYLPVIKEKNGELDFIAERDPRIIFDRMVAWFIRHNAPVPISSQEFQAGLAQRFVEHDGMVFLDDQGAKYNKRRAQVANAPQMDLFVSDERSAIDWLAEFLKRRPSTYQEIHPEFTKQLGAGWRKHEAKPELAALLEDNFLKYEGGGDVPSQIHSYLSTNHKDLRGLEKGDPRLVAKAKDRWFVPDPNKAQDLEKKREKALLKEFETYLTFTGRKLKEFRLEVLRTGFKEAWVNKDYQTIIQLAQKIPEASLQEDEQLLMWYDHALTRMEADA